MPARILLALAVLAFTLLQAGTALAGYTHYWRWRARPDPAALGRCVDDMERIVEARRGLLVDSEGRTQGAAVFRLNVVFGDAGAPQPALVFNGIGDAGHETFGFPLAPFTAENPAFQFVKTAQKPYDEVVVACLIAARDCFARDVLTLSSDGTWAQDWAAGALLYEKTLGRRAKNPLDPPAAVLPGASSASAPGGDGTTSRDPPPPPREKAPARKKVLLGVIVLLALAIAFVVTREAR